MTKSSLCILFIYLCSLPLFGQVKNTPPIFKARKDRNNFNPDPGKLYAKVGLLNLFHPSAPSIDLGLELMLTKHLSLEMMYGLKTPKVDVSAFEQRIYFDSYYKLSGSVRWFWDERTSSLRRRGSPGKNYVAFEGYFSKANTLEKANFALDKLSDLKLEYNAAEIDKKVQSINIKSGYIFLLSKNLELEFSMGLGLIRYQRDYILFTPLRTTQTFSEALIGPYDDRNIGRMTSINGIVNLKLNYKIF